MLQGTSVMNMRLEFKFRNTDTWNKLHSPVGKIHKSTEQTATGSPCVPREGEREQEKVKEITEEHLVYHVWNISPNK